VTVELDDLLPGSRTLARITERGESLLGYAAAR
jgi:hypothetical protein